MAMQALVRGRFPQDSIDFVGFYSGAAKIPEVMLPLTHAQARDHLRLPGPPARPDQSVGQSPPAFHQPAHGPADWPGESCESAPAKTNRFSSSPTASPPPTSREILFICSIPPDPRSTVATLKEAVTAVREGCRISTFALIEDYWGMDWVGFVDQLTKLTKGVAFYTSSGELASCIMESYLSGRKKKQYIA